MKIKIFSFSAIILIMVGQFCLAESSINSTIFQKKELPGSKLNLESMGFEQCDLAKEVDKKVYLVSCENPAKDNEEDYGQRLYLISMETKKPKILFEEHGAMDAYAIHLTFFSNLQSDQIAFVLAESGAEYSWGVSVYLLKSRTMHWIGYIGAMLPKTSESAIVNIIIEGIKGDYIFSFTSDVDIPKDEDDQESYFTVSKDEIKYVYSIGKFERVLSPRLNKYIAE